MNPVRLALSLAREVPNKVRRTRQFHSFDQLVKEGVVEVGRHSYGKPKVRTWVSADGRIRHGGRLLIGAFTSIGDGVQILTGGEHVIGCTTTSPLRTLLNLPGVDRDGQPSTKGDVVIGNDVWIGSEAMILSGVHIGDGAVIGARALVSRNVPPYAVAAGNPARVVRFRFEPHVIQDLLALSWWTWPDELVAQRADLLLSTRSEDIERLILLGRGSPNV